MTTGSWWSMSHCSTSAIASSHWLLRSSNERRSGPQSRYPSPAAAAAPVSSVDHTASSRGIFLASRSTTGLSSALATRATKTGINTTLRRARLHAATASAPATTTIRHDHAAPRSNTCGTAHGPASRTGRSDMSTPVPRVGDGETAAVSRRACRADEPGPRRATASGRCQRRAHPSDRRPGARSRVPS